MKGVSVTNYKEVNNELKPLYNLKHLKVLSFQKTRNEITKDFLNELEQYETIVVVQQNELLSDFENDTTTLRHFDKNLFYFNNSNIVEFFEQIENYENKWRIEKDIFNEKIIYTSLETFFKIVFEETSCHFDLLIIY